MPTDDASSGHNLQDIKRVYENKEGTTELNADLRNKRGVDHNPVELVLGPEGPEKGEELIDAIKQTLERENTRLKTSTRGVEADLSINIDEARQIGEIFDKSVNEMVKSGALMVEGEIEKASLSKAKYAVKKKMHPVRWSELKNSYESILGMTPEEIGEKVKGRKLQLQEKSFLSENYPSQSIEGELPELLDTSFKNSPNSQEKNLRIGLDGRPKYDIELKGEKKSGKQVELLTTLKPESIYLSLDMRTY